MKMFFLLLISISFLSLCFYCFERNAELFKIIWTSSLLIGGTLSLAIFIIIDRRKAKGPDG